MFAFYSLRITHGYIKFPQKEPHKFHILKKCFHKNFKLTEEQRS